MSVLNIFGGIIKDCKIINPSFAVETETLAGTKILANESPMIQFLDPGGVARNVDLPAEETSKGAMFIIVNRADAIEIITVRNDAAATIATPTQAETAVLVCDGIAWSGFVALLA